ncbi:MAG: phage protein Gp36 family protein [Bacteroidales bacterium]
MNNFILTSDYDQAIHTEILSAIIRTDASILETTEDRAVAEMTSYLSSRYDCTAIFSQTGSQRHPLIVGFCIDICLYHLHAIYNPMKFPQMRQDRYDRAIEWLKGVRNGNIQPIGLPLMPTDNTTGSPAGFILSSNKKRINHY